jgi:arginine transport system substrate-binding protein
MHKWRLIGLALTGLLLSCTFIILLFGEIIFADSAQSIKFGTYAAYPPFELVNKSGEIQGYDIDIAMAICKQMNVTCSFENEPFNVLIPHLLQKKYDAVISAMGATEERKTQVNFSDIYYTPTASYVAPIAKHYSMGDIVGKTIGVQKGSTFEDYLGHKYNKSVNVRSYAQGRDAYNDLQAGHVDLVLSDTVSVKTWLKQDKHDETFGIVVGPMINAKYFGAGFAITVRKDEIELLTSFNKALADIKANGTYDVITKKYFAEVSE